MRQNKLWRLDATKLLIPIVLFATAIAGSVATGASGPAPVAAYSFDAGSGTALVDMSGNGNTGTISGATWTTGKTAGALNFDGVNDWVTVADAASLDLKTGMTLEAWVRPTRNNGDWRTVAFKESSTGMVYSLYTNERGNRPVGQVNIGGERNVLAPTLPVSTWTHLAVTFDGSKLRLYTNAALAGSVDVSGSIPATALPLRIGGNAIWGEWFAGQIDDLRIYDRALSASELDADMKTPVGATTPPPPPADTQAPTAPTNFAVTGRTTSSVSVSWAAATDNTGVTGYRLYRDAATTGTTQSTTATFSGLACGTTYAFAVEAYDAAGNKSPKTSVSAASADCPTSAGSPVAAYSFDAGSGATLADLSGKGNSGSLENATWSSGKNGGGLSFDGSNDSVLIADSASLDLSTGMTLEAWVNPTSAGPNWRTVFFKETADGTAYSLYASERNSLPVGQVDIGGERNAMGGTLPLDTWSHLAVTYDGAALRLYVNGAQSGTIAVSGAIPASSGPLRIGGNSIWGEWFAGRIDDARVYPRALSAAEIQSDMNTPVSGNGSSTPTPTPTPPPADTQAPTAPTNLRSAGSTDTTISVSWTASVDNTVVASYGAYRGNSLVGTPSNTSYTYSGLLCNTSYDLAVDAVDTSGNRSGKATLTASTGACPAAPPSSSNGTANLWVDPNGGSCARQASPGAYSDAAACASMGAAYAKASPGDVILVRGGTYPAQQIASRSIGTTPVVIQPASGETVTVSESILISTHDLIIDGGGTVGVNEPNRILIQGEPAPANESALDFGRGNNSPGVNNVIVEDVHSRNVYFDDNTHHNTIRFSEVGPSDYAGHGNLCADLLVTGGVDDTVIEYNAIHDNKGDGCGGAHIDALDLNMNNGVVRGNRIWSCGTQCLFTGDPGSMLVEHNMIEETNSCGGCDGPQEMGLMGTNEVRFNTIEVGGVGWGREPDRPGVSNAHHNLWLGSPGCTTDTTGEVRVTCDSNVSITGSGGTNSKTCTPRLLSGQLWTNVDRQADFFLDPTDPCSAGVGARPAKQVG